MHLRRVITAAAALTLTMVGNANAATRLVDDDLRQCPKAPFQTVQAAVDAAARGDVVVVCDGSYSGDVIIDRDTGNWSSPDDPALVVKAHRPRRATIRGFVRACNFDGPVVLRDFVIEGTVRAGCTFGDATVERNLVLGSVRHFNGYALIRDNTISGYAGTGIETGGSNFGLGGYSRIVGNRLEGTPGSVGIEVVEGSPRCYGAANAAIEANVITGNAVGVLTTECQVADLIDNRITGNVTGARLYSVDTITGNRITGNSGDGLVVGPLWGVWGASRVVRNDMRGNGGTDCVLVGDPGDATWIANQGQESSPAGFCTPSGR